MPFPAINALFDPFFPKGLQWYWKGDFVKSLPDEAIDTHIAQAAAAPSDCRLMHLYPIDGAVHRVAKDATAWSARDATWSMVIAGIDPRSEAGRGAEDVGTRVLEGRPPVQPGGRLRQLHDGRRGRRPRPGDLRRQLRAPGGGQGEVRPEEPLPREPEHRAGGRLTGRQRRNRSTVSLGGRLFACVYDRMTAATEAAGLRAHRERLLRSGAISEDILEFLTRVLVIQTASSEGGRAAPIPDTVLPAYSGDSLVPSSRLPTRERRRTCRRHREQRRNARHPPYTLLTYGRGLQSFAVPSKVSTSTPRIFVQNRFRTVAR